ncbi:PCNA-interacting partner [Parasteatoda tepidariorum]|uniref:PCNA-interacting partner n=1 Tax=Parasteatoda tepidariorum TaxID=114398 RepID=UPI00077F847E|nr:PCNA-interacting partner [Parasteatoda tepidariorum]XP_015920915.1 PCNA-interacting partner [Parasteatoda tepidariorum]XP_015920916.1 PCNA-interacting partner [Parasteatoda tepidariorum]XP_042904664.1 PCNA-interacting partner [Parasteatoda tepidariorum]XP_042904665.1 PCNA-interacting partner [Parasteatoda tepidariorum]
MSGNFNVFVWKEPDLSLKEKVLTFIKSQEPLDRKVIILHGDVADDIEDSIPLIFYIYIKCLQFKIIENEKLMYLNPKDLCQAAELCLERLKIQENEDKGESLVHCHESYRRELLETNEASSPAAQSLKGFITENNCIDIWKMLSSFQKYKSINNQFSQHISEVKFLILGAIDSFIFKEIISFLNCETILSIVIETPLNISVHESPSAQSSSTITTELMNVNEYCSNVEKPMHLKSATQEYCKEIITAFLSLLINSRNELALSKVMISPFINLSHEAFTHLKHLAIQKEMPMCQTAISYVTKVRLGGKGYAPPKDCPMMPHIKCLELFVDTLNHLQTIMEEDVSPKSSIKRLINTLKNKLLKCDDSKFKQSAIEKTTNQLHLLTDRVLEFAKSQQCLSHSPQICQETLDILHYLINYVNCKFSTFNPKKILLERHCKQTPINRPPLLGYFRSPEDETTCEENSVTINEDSIVSNSSSLGYPQPFMSYFHNSDNSCSTASVAPACTTPTKTNFKDCIKKKESIKEVFEDESHPAVNGKRSILSDIANINVAPVKKIKTAAETTKLIKVKVNSKKVSRKVVKKTSLSKQFKLIADQGKITSYFSVV